MKQLLRQRLMEYGWRDQMKAYCKGIVPRSMNSIRSVRFFPYRNC